MQGMSIWGLVLTLLQVFSCGAEVMLGLKKPTFSTNLPEETDTFSGFSAGTSLKNLLDPNLYYSENKTVDENNQNSLKLVHRNPLNTILNMTFLENHSLDNSYSRSADNSTDNTVVNSKNTRRNSTASGRKKRSSGFLGIPIPTLLPLYRGPDEPSDICERDEIMHFDGECHQLLSQGPCENAEVVLMDPNTKKGYCAPRLCSPDRVFVFGDQLCHDPYENDVCPPGRILFTTSTGAPACGCPYGLYEEDEDTDEDVCKPVLAKLEQCPSGEVYWFRNFRTEPECLPDPCSGLNARRSPNDLPYVPSAFDGKCYQLGEELPQCPSDTFYTLSYTSLSGICASLEEAGYTVLDEDMLETFASLFGPRLPRDVSSGDRSSSVSKRVFSKSSDDIKSSQQFSISDINLLNSQDDTFRSKDSDSKDVDSSDSRQFAGSSNAGHISVSTDRFGSDTGSRVTRPKVGSSVMPSVDSNDDVLALHIGQSVTSNRARPFNSNLAADNKAVWLTSTHATAFSPSAISLDGLSSITNFFKQFLQKKGSEEEHEEPERKRRKRNVLPHAAPETVFQSTLASCRAGGEVGVNFKCNTKYLPNRPPLSRPKRSIAPIFPHPPCPKGSLFSITRKCVSNESKVRSSLISLGLG